jgi:hypothetical protein
MKLWSLISNKPINERYNWNKKIDKKGGKGQKRLV